MEIRLLSEHDTEDIVRIDEKLGGSGRLEHWENRLLYAIRRDPEGSWVAVDPASKRVIGFLLADCRGEEFGLPSKTGWIEVLAVHPDHQRKNVASALLTKAVEHLQKQGATDIRTLVHPHNHAHLAEFFQGQGFACEPLVVYRKSV